MDIKTYRAASMQDALKLVRSELGPEAAVLHTREVRMRGLRGWLSSSREIEVTASVAVNVPSRLPQQMQGLSPMPTMPSEPDDFRARMQASLHNEQGALESIVEAFCRKSEKSPQHELPDSLFRVFTDMIEADVSEDVARELLGRVRSELRPGELSDSDSVKRRLAELVESEISVTGPVHITPGRRRLVALVGQTGVGKTTTIAKLAANFRLREKRRVGLITVDTYRIAAVEQLRTYADIIDLPMEVVSTPREMREAVARLANLDLILLDTAGRSPRDEVKIQELKSMLTEAEPDEVHLVLSAVAGAANLKTTAERFAEVGVGSLIITKLDEATGLGHLLPLLRSSNLALSYLTNGQNVPDDIAIADRERMALGMLGME